LPEREYRAGLAEVIKYGFVCDADFFCWLENKQQAIKARDAEVLEALVARCCAIKQSIVAIDMHDRQQRQILNFGHSFAHAIEAATDFKYYLHGEAVALGMLLASRLAVKIGVLELTILDRLVKLLENLELNLTLQAEICNPSVLINYIKYDKKKQAGAINLILPCALGKAVIMSEHEVSSIEDILSYV
jgi:3-dehydroquinate synthase